MKTARRGRAWLGPIDDPAAVLIGDHRGFKLSLRPLWQQGHAPRASRKPLGLDASSLDVRVHLTKGECADPRALRMAFARAIAAGPIRVELDGAIAFVGYVERSAWQEARDDRGDFTEANLDLVIVGEEV